MFRVDCDAIALYTGVASVPDLELNAVSFHKNDGFPVVFMENGYLYPVAFDFGPSESVGVDGVDDCQRVGMSERCHLRNPRHLGW